MAPTRNYPMCKNSAGYNRTRNFGLYGHAESKKTQKFVFRSALRPNQISFLHDQDPNATSASYSTSLSSCAKSLSGPWGNAVRRREFITLIGAATAWPVVARGRRRPANYRPSGFLGA